MKLHTMAFALTAGILWAIGVFLFTWWMILLGDGAIGERVPIFSDMYLMYRITPMGSIVGMLWGFLDGAIGGLVFAWMYNFLVMKMKREKVTTPGPEVV